MRTLLYNTLSGLKEELLIPKNPIRLFVCGPTVYDHTHIGHARTYIVFDAFVKYLTHRGVSATYLQNITDIDDKIITRALKLQITPKSLAKKYESLYLRDIKRLGITSVSSYARATDHIPQIIDQVNRLLKKDIAYEIPGSGYYFDISKFPRYGALAGRTISQAEDAISRIDEGTGKRNKGDFVLWKIAKKITKAPKNTKLNQIKMKLVEGEPAWWGGILGWGRPGWHIEDTAITEHFFGPQYNIHGGAIDLKFPHHEAEIAQQESLSDKTPMARVWMHTGFLLVNGQKMSKSAGNFITIDKFLKNHSSSALRFLILSHHYRSPIDYNEDQALEAERSIDTFFEFLEKLEFIQNHASTKSRNAITPELTKKAEEEFYSAMDDDFNTPGSLAALFTLVRDSQKTAWNFSKEEATGLREFLVKKLEILGVRPVIHKIPASIHKLIALREKSRASSQFTKADALRKKMEGLGYTVEDTPLGPFARKQLVSKRSSLAR